MSVATTYSFDSVGDALPTLREHEKIAFEQTTIKYNPKTPLRLSTDKSSLFVMNKDLISAVSDNLKNLVLTNRGERVMAPDFGANLKAILSEFGTDGFDGEVMKRIKTATQKYLPYVSLSTMSMEKLDRPPSSGLVTVVFTIGYSVPAAGENNLSLTVTMNTIA